MPRRFWTPQELATLADLYPTHSAAEIARLLGRKVLSVYQGAKKLGVKKTQAYLAEHCRLKKGEVIPGSEKHRFIKGQLPHNTGLRRPGYHRGGMRETQFKKGVRSGIAAKNWVPVGTVLPDSDGYLRIKVREAVFGKEPTGAGNPDVWPQLHRCIWELHHGPIPLKHIVVFKDRDRQNCVIENLELISLAENARRNRMWTNYPPELARAIQINGVLKRKIRSLLNGKE